MPSRLKPTCRKLLLLLLFAVAGISSAQAQGGNRLDIITTDVFSQVEINGRSVRKLISNVHLRQDSTDFFCDSAYHYIDSNVVEAFGRVRILLSRKISITANSLTYDGENKIANLYNNITLKDEDVTLRTNRLTYYRKEDYGRYFTGGTLENGANILRSKEGFYYPQEKMAYFYKDVELISQDEGDTVPDYTLTTDSLGYNTDTEVAIFMAPTRVENEVNKLYTEEGFYDTKNDVANFTGRAQLGDTSYSIYADTIFYDQANDKGHAEGNIILLEADSSLTIYGNKAEFESGNENAYITDSAYAVQVLEGDTLYLFADTLVATSDADSQRIFLAYNNVRIFMSGLQGICDSLAYMYSDSIIYFFQDPVLWSEVNQIVGDTIKVFMKHNQIDSMSIPKNSFIVSEEDTVGFNQIKGKALEAKFKNNDLFMMTVTGNNESIYYAKDENEHYFAMNEAKCNQMKVHFEDNKPSRIVFIDKPDGTLYPIHEVLFDPKKLPGFDWREDERPVKPENIYMIIPRDLPDSLSAPPVVLPGETGIEFYEPDSLMPFVSEATLEPVRLEVYFPPGFASKKSKGNVKGGDGNEKMSRKERKALKKRQRKLRKEARKEARRKRKEEKKRRKALKKAGKNPAPPSENSGKGKIKDE